MNKSKTGFGSNPELARIAGAKGGSAPYEGKKGFAADLNRAKEAGRKGALKRWENAAKLKDEA
jgi:general stress protein YciG